jgi:two-component system sensor histidine kinase UhpB
MQPTTSVLTQIQTRLKRVPIVYRLLVGNSMIAILSVMGAFLLHRYTSIPENTLVVVFALAGFGIVFGFNYFTIRVSLSSLNDLRQTLDQINLDQPTLPETIVLETDPDLQPLAASINAMLVRLERHRQQLRALSERATSAQEEERRRIARNLHDDTSQSLSSLIINLERLEGELPQQAAHLKPALQQARRVATQTLDELRNIIFDLRPAMLDDLGLVPAVRWYARTKLGEMGIRVDFQIPDESLRLPAHLETELFRMAQEGLNNIARHAQAQRVIVRLTRAPDFVCLELEDDGRGFDVVQASGQALPSKRLGLLGIQERVSLVGGDLTITSSPGEGTLLRVCIPCPVPNAKEDI